LVALNCDVLNRRSVLLRHGMCGRITQKGPHDQLRLTILMGTPDDPRVTKAKAR
jgi:hypothetical protein